MKEAKGCRFGPQVIVLMGDHEDDTKFMVVYKHGVIFPSSKASPSVILAVIIATYYLLDLTYPSSFAQTLGAIQETVLQKEFIFKSKICSNMLNLISSS